MPDKMTDRRSSHPLSVALETLTGTAGIVFQPPHPATPKEKEGWGDIKKKYGAPCHPLGEEIPHNRFLMATLLQLCSKRENTSSSSSI